MQKVFIYDPTASDKLSSVRGVGRYLQILKENFPKEFVFTSKIKNLDLNKNLKFKIENSVFINPFFNFLQKPLTMKRIAKKQICVIHDLIPLKYPAHFPAGIRGNINIFLNKIALKNYDLTITDSEASKRDIVNILRVDEKRIKVIYPCLPKVFLNPNDKIQNPNQAQNPKSKNSTSHQSLITSHYCLYVGDATWNKNLVNLVKAIKIINVTCIFVGKVFTSHQSLITSHYFHPWQKEFKQFIEETKDDKRFIFAGFLPDSDLINLYKQATLNILPSRDEGFGFSYVEAAQFSCPTVLSGISVLKEISGGQAFFADPENPNDLADKIGEIYFNKEIRNNLGKKAFERSKFFSGEKFRKTFLRLLE